MKLLHTILFMVAAVSINGDSITGDFCGSDSPFVNKLEMYFCDESHFNASASIFGKKNECDNQVYIYNSTDENIDISSNENTCLEKLFNKYNIQLSDIKCTYDGTNIDFIVDGQTVKLTEAAC